MKVPTSVAPPEIAPEVKVPANPRLEVAKGAIRVAVGRIINMIRKETGDNQ